MDLTPYPPLPRLWRDLRLNPLPRGERKADFPLRPSIGGVILTKHRNILGSHSLEGERQGEGDLIGLSEIVPPLPRLRWFDLVPFDLAQGQ